MQVGKRGYEEGHKGRNEGGRKEKEQMTEESA